MKPTLSIWKKLFIAAFCFGIAIVGFMLKLPSMFRGMDKEMHAAFYFLAAAFLNILFAKRNFIIHVFIFVFLYLFGYAIELAQEYSNKFFHKRIHGRFDPEDVASNLQGLLYFSALWTVYAAISFLLKKPAGVTGSQATTE
jgi:ABC-type multidrug transport system fused ATPase/permease subunit